MGRPTERRRIGFDSATELVSRRLASHTTRRSFLGWMGKGAMLVAGGSSVVGVLANRAEARVCGQSGVSPKCPTYNCEDAVWGWCWYANGCCAGGRLKKICDCCAPVNNVHGYCPSGTNVKCIVESCGNDPRVQTVPVSRVPTDNAIIMAVAFSRARFARNSKPVVTISSAEDPLSAAMAATVAAATNGPLLLTPGGDLGAEAIAEMQRLAATEVKVVGLNLSNAIDTKLSAYGWSIERISNESDHGAMSAEVADWVRAKTGATRAVCVETTGVSLSMAPLAGAAAASKKMLLLIGVAAAALKSKTGVTLTYMVGPEAAAGAGQVAGSRALHSKDSFAMASELAGFLSSVENTDVSNITLAPYDGNPGLAASPGLVLLHTRPDSIDAAKNWMFNTREGFKKAYAVGVNGALNNEGYYQTQSLVNGFEAHLLIGVSGEGLPVISQPDAERPLGRARVAPIAESPALTAYWTDRG